MIILLTPKNTKLVMMSAPFNTDILGMLYELRLYDRDRTCGHQTSSLIMSTTNKSESFRRYTALFQLIN